MCIYCVGGRANFSPDPNSEALLERCRGSYAHLGSLSIPGLDEIMRNHVNELSA
jgi:hypothetical protein